MDNSKVLTIQDLFEACKKEMKKGNGNKHILISSDEEGNWYHELYFLFTPVNGKDIDYALPMSPEEFDKDFVILG